MKHIVHVGMSVHEAREQDVLRREAHAARASLAFLQHGTPSLVTELDRLAAEGATRIELVRVEVGGAAPGTGFARRVTGRRW